MIPVHTRCGTVHAVAAIGAHVEHRDPQAAKSVGLGDHVAADLELAHVVNVRHRAGRVGSARRVGKVTRIADFDELHVELIDSATKRDQTRIGLLSEEQR